MILLRYSYHVFYFMKLSSPAKKRKKKKKIFIKAYKCTNNQKPKLGLIEKIKNITKNVKTRVKLFCLFVFFSILYHQQLVAVT